jgi:hypothetical protein
MVPIYATIGAKPLAIFSTKGEGPVSEDHFLTNDLAQLQFRHPVGEDPDSLLEFIRVLYRRNKEEVQFLIQRDRYIIQTTAALLSLLAKEAQPHQ